MSDCCFPGNTTINQPPRPPGEPPMASCCKGGVQIYEYEPTVLRTKTIVDGIFSVLGSSNFDARFAQINEELDTVYDKAFGREMQEVFERDLLRSRRYTLEDFEKRSLWERFIEWVMLPFHSQI
jgi:cardiolipin synthase A/B